ncbi:hypothetical protein PS858_01130 [Pseudomonas fluorescens]|uniref:hypothetical protein n=1 Tax=Pseudomonas fluorescens TaxID=294 RepID=UPI0012421A8C|nr:hypothetical protein [Pseudomonas fluorescens]VVO67785.1 hypothetical protein PS858_01130 [Pseudomonas fluorescens]
MSAVVNWPALSFLEHLRPGPNENVELALLSFYSADLGSIGAALLALAGKDSDAGRGSPTDFAEAVELLRGKVRVVIQRGRLARMQRTPRMAAVLDQFVREVDFDEASHSWHAKAALVRLRREDGSQSWRLWVGSRNLTECMNRDLGLLLVSAAKGTQIPGVEKLAHALAKQAGLKGIGARALAASVADVTWQAPSGVTVECLLWSDGNGTLALPTPRDDTEAVVVVSPFIDHAFLSALALPMDKPRRRVLLSTLREIERAGPSLPAFYELLALDAPDYPLADAPSEEQSASEQVNDGERPAEEEAVGNGLHAKLLFMRSGQQRWLWLGSANATMRAWSGRNVEVMARLRIDKQVEQGLLALLGSARPVEHPKVEYEPDTAAIEQELLERARAQVAARWAVRQSIMHQQLWLEQQEGDMWSGPHPDHPDIVLEVGTLCGALQRWPANHRRIEIEPPPAAERSDFVLLRVSYGDRGLCWLQRAPTDPELGEERDRAAFVHFLGAHGFLRWVSAMLAEEGGHTDADWRSPGSGKGDDQQGSTASWEAWMPTMEDILAAWSPDSTVFPAIEQRVSRYMPALLERARHDEAWDTLVLLQRFEALWGQVYEGLGVGSSRKKPR